MPGAIRDSLNRREATTVSRQIGQAFSGLYYIVSLKSHKPDLSVTNCAGFCGQSWRFFVLVFKCRYFSFHVLDHVFIATLPLSLCMFFFSCDVRYGPIGETGFYFRM